MKGHSMCPELNHLPLVSLTTSQVLYTFSTTNTLRKKDYFVNQTIENQPWRPWPQVKVSPERIQTTSITHCLLAWNESEMYICTYHQQIAIYSQMTSNLSPILAGMLLYTRLNLACLHMQITGLTHKKGEEFCFNCCSVRRLYSQACWNVHTALFTGHKYTTACN